MTNPVNLALAVSGVTTSSFLRGLPRLRRDGDSDLAAHLIPAAAYLRRFLDLHGGTLQTQRLKWIGAGGTHFVFADPDGSQDYVIKIARQPNDAGQDPSRGNAESGCAATSNDRLRRYFPAQWLAPSYMASAPVVMLDGTFRAAATVLVQSYEANFLNNDRVGLQKVYPELRTASAGRTARYRSINTLLTGPWSSRAIGDFVAGCPNLAKIATLVLADEGFYTIVTALLTGTERLVAETSEIIDLAGNDNVFFYNTDRGWTCRIGDVVKQDRLDHLNDLLGRLRSLDELTNRELAVILNGLVFVRLLNFLSVLVRGRTSIDLKVSDQALQILWQRFECGFWLGRLAEPLRLLHPEVAPAPPARKTRKR